MIGIPSPVPTAVFSEVKVPHYLPVSLKGGAGWCPTTIPMEFLHLGAEKQCHFSALRKQSGD